MHICTNEYLYKSILVQIFKCTNTYLSKYILVQTQACIYIYTRTNTSIYKCTNVKMHKCTNVFKQNYFIIRIQIPKDEDILFIALAKSKLALETPFLLKYFAVNIWTFNWPQFFNRSQEKKVYLEKVAQNCFLNQIRPSPESRARTFTQASMLCFIPNLNSNFLNIHRRIKFLKAKLLQIERQKGLTI